MFVLLFVYFDYFPGFAATF